MDGAPFRILILGDFGGRDHRGVSDAASLGTRRALKVDRDDLDAAIARVGPELRLEIEPGGDPVVVRPTALDDFHPDNIVQKVADFQRLRALRAAALADPRVATQTLSPPRTADTAAAMATGGSLLDMILDADPASGATRSAARPQDDLSAFVSRAVRPHVVAAPTADQQTLIEKIDGVITATMRVVLHHPDFQAAESLWRGVSFLVRRVETDESLEVYVADVSRRELEQAADASSDASWKGAANTAARQRSRRAGSVVRGNRRIHVRASRHSVASLGGRARTQIRRTVDCRGEPGLRRR